MEFEIAIIALLLLVALAFLATIDMAFSQLSDVSLRRIASEVEEQQKRGSAAFLQEILENRPHFRFALSAAIQVLLVTFAVFAALIVYRFHPTPREILLYGLPLALILSIIFRQLIPRVAVGRTPENKLLLLLPVVHPLYRLWSLVVEPFSIFFKHKEKQKLENTVIPESAEEKSEDAADDIQALMEVGEA